MKSHITVIETVYFQEPNRQPAIVETRFSRWLKSDDEQPYARVMKLTEEWKELDCGWVKEASLIVLVNEEGKFRKVNPTDEERQSANARIIEVGLRFQDDNPLLILPGESLRFLAKDWQAVRLRSQKGEARCNVTIFPN